MGINVDHPGVLDLIAEYRAPERWDSAAFLIWYLENYYRLDPQEAIDAVCDKKNDKGVDGIWVDDDEESIIIFQSRMKHDPAKTIGDSSLSQFAGTLLQFKSKTALDAMLAAAGMAKVASLVKRLDLISKIDTYTISGEFLSNLNIDNHGEAYLKAAPNISFVGKKHLEKRYISSARKTPHHRKVTFNTQGYNVTEYQVDTTTRAVIAPVKALELVQLEGISDQSIFEFNVRGPLGKTAINKAIVASIKNRSLHKSFPLFHNGITVIAPEVKVRTGSLSTKDYFVVNGCQSLTALFDNQGELTSDLRILTKFIQLKEGSPLGEIITRFSNNQNGVRVRDFMSNNRTQIRLQRDFGTNYHKQYFFEIKRGETHGAGIVITNETAGLYRMAFDLKEPWGTHRRYQVFGEKHAEIFGGPEVTSHRIVMLHVIMEAIDSALDRLENRSCAKYLLTKFFFLYTIRLMIDNDPIGPELLLNPKTFVRKTSARDKFRSCARTIAEEIVVDLNLELKQLVQQLGDDFDYRDKMRDETWVNKLAYQILALRIKLVQQDRMPSIKAIWDK
jgi:hypothetical protein